MQSDNTSNKNVKQRDLIIGSMNCRGLAGFEKRRDVLHYLRKKNYSIYCLQDVHFEKDIEKKVRSEWGLDCYFSSFKSNARGVAIFINNDFEYKVCDSRSDKNGNLLALDIKINDLKITLINIYGPNNDSPEFFDEVQNIVNIFDNPHNIICGDWNLVLDPHMDCCNYVRLNNPKARDKVLSLCQELDLIDPWRIQNPETRRYTWRQHDSNKQARLDFFLISSADHSLVEIKFDFCKIDRGNGYWKFNNSLLCNKEYVDLVNVTISEVVKQYAVVPYNFSNLKSIHPKDIHFNINDQLFFEMLLMEIRAKTISYSARKKKEMFDLETKLYRTGNKSPLR